MRALLNRWPAALGVAFAVSRLATDDPQSLSGVLLVLMLATTGYVVIAASVRPGWSWSIVGALVVLVLATRLTSTGPVVELAVMVVIIVAAIVTGLIRRTWTRSDLYRWQPYAAVAFVAISLGALWLSPEAGRVLIAAGLVGHALWDLAHWRRHQVVSRSLSEWCGALDFTLGLGVLVLTLWPGLV
ncbi:hypothetical protein Q3W71_16450 [Micromonospora sp. C28SCA-DRY-2]|uniref:hypothetical protein n=1 Tax=Micromonospora sp. C28SCA-DRY-2 TaxID=3059522 RepID=UPI0026771706|nr:hypothetical protein [Micromonospora sp. C28SCA-DRY-2]MDO3703265.1 hypothetical protein [Micromonospora sp. C28SCA-DRY-2]